jgi:oxalate decarboxylase
MTPAGRRSFLGAAAAGGLIATHADALGAPDGHAAGTDVAPAANPMPLVPRRPGDAPGFSISLDRAPIKATSGGWAREITTRQLPIATGLAAAHLFLNPGGSREMHWHNSAEWAYVIGGRAQATVVTPEARTEVFNVGPGDLWYFPRGYPHAIQTIGEDPCHALLMFDDGAYSEHGTFGITDVLSRLDADVLTRMFGVPPAAFSHLPQGEVYIMQGAVIAQGGAEAKAERLLDPAHSHRFHLLAAAPAVSIPGGTIRVASEAEFPVSAGMAGQLIRLEPSAIQALHWHPDANEMHYLLRGKLRLTMYSTDKHLAHAEMEPGDCAYIPMGCAHMAETIGLDPVEFITVIDRPRLRSAMMADWMAHAPRHLLANNIGIDSADPPGFRAAAQIVAGTG